MSEKSKFGYESIPPEKQKLIGETAMRNASDSIDKELARVVDPQQSKMYQETEGFTGQYEEGMSPEQAHQEGQDNGVNTKPDGSIELRSEGQAHPVNPDGVPKD